MKNKLPLITVAVPAYKRPDMILDSIKSFKLQSYKKAELLIVDDCPSDTEVKRVVDTYAKKDSRIRFIKNKNNLGYCKNLLKCLHESKGDYIVILGDDDIFINHDTLKKYVEVFNKYPNVSYIYSNILQFNADYEMDYGMRLFLKDTLYTSTESSLKNIWLNSCYIPGIGLRNNIEFNNLYPKTDILFPQVELIGKILASSSAYGISSFLIGGRAHEQQLGFAAIRGEHIKKDEKHSVFELNIIFETVKSFYKKINKKSLQMDKNFVDSFFELTHATNLPNEKINTGNMKILKTFNQALKNNKKILLNYRFLFYFVISLLLPRRLLRTVKEWRKKQIIKANFSKEEAYFKKYIKKIHAN